MQCGRKQIGETQVVRNAAAQQDAIFRSLSWFVAAIAFLTAQAVPFHLVAQAPQVHQPAGVALRSDACPVVLPGDSLSLDFRPDFDPSSAVSGLHTLALTFSGLLENGVTINPRPAFVVGGHLGPVSVSSLGNGYYHIVIAFNLRVAPGEYHLTDAQGVAEVFSDYQGQQPQMVVSPVPERYCITVAPLTNQSNPTP